LYDDQQLNTFQGSGTCGGPLSVNHPACRNVGLRGGAQPRFSVDNFVNNFPGKSLQHTQVLKKTLKMPRYFEKIPLNQ
jgi:hypothetical protein